MRVPARESVSNCSRPLPVCNNLIHEASQVCERETVSNSEQTRKALFVTI
jgi:hypothetical protein